MVLLNDPQTFRGKQEVFNLSAKSKHFSGALWGVTARKNAAVFSGAAVVAGLVMGGMAAGIKQVALRQASASPTTALLVPMTVGEGESFWSIARKYGSSDDYILDRVNALAKANGMTAHASLVPGQRILVPVSNPVEVARLQTHVAKR